MKKLLLATFMASTCLAQMPKSTSPPSPASILGTGTLTCNLYGCTIYNATGPNTLVVQAGSAQSTTDLFQVKNAAGGLIASFNADGAVTPYGMYDGVGPNYYALVGGTFRAYNDFAFKWSAGATYNAPYDLSLLRKSAGLLKAGDGSTGYGSVEANSITAVALATPVITSVTPTCVPGDCNLTWTYKSVAKAGDATTTEASAAVSTALQNGTLDADNYNTVLTAAVTGSTSCDVYRTVSGGTPATTGLIGNVACGMALVDNGLAGDSGAAPTANTTGTVTAAKVAAGPVTGTTGVFSSTLSAAPGGIVPAWIKYSIVKIANGANGCTNAKGCWQNNGARFADAAASPAQTLNFLAAPVNAELERMQWKTTTACAGLTAITLTDAGTTASESEFFTGGTYNLKTAVGDTNLLWLTLLTPGLTRAATNWSVRIAGGAENIEDITDGCAFDIMAKWAVMT